jgi:hypothetical protein
MDYTFDGGEAPMVEVASAGDSPYALSVTLLDPVTQNLICLQLSVELGGTIRAILHSSLLGTLSTLSGCDVALWGGAVLGLTVMRVRC